jgi:hypothetical protein
MSKSESFKQASDFTNHIHDTIAIHKIYTPLGFTEVKSEVGSLLDLRKGIDYVGKINNTEITIQERFRKNIYKDYRDITFRYDRPSNNRKSEYFKIESDVFLYGIINDKEDDFEWAYMFEVEPVLQAIKNKTLKYKMRSNKGEKDTRFIAIDIFDIDAIGATILKYRLK